MPALGEIADWASIAGALLTVANGLALLWIGRRIRFNLTADQVIGRVESVRLQLSDHVAYAPANRSAVIDIANRCIAILGDTRKLSDRTSRHTIDGCVDLSERLLGVVTRANDAGTVEPLVVELHGRLSRLTEDLMSLRDRRRAGP